MSNTPETAGPPPHYTLVYTLIVATPRNLLWLNVGGVAVLGVAGALVLGLLWLYHGALGGPLVLPGLPAELPAWLGLVALLALVVVHEWLHGLAIRASGHRPRYGVKLHKGVFFATADHAYFTRRQYLAVTLAPLVGISAAGLALALLTPPGVAVWCGLLVAVNAGSAIGDLWMARVARRYPPAALFRDEEDGMSVFLPEKPES